MYKPHTQCRACGYASPGPGGTKSPNSEKLIKVFDLGVQPLANDFCAEGQERSGYAPMEVMFCPRCTLAQLSVVVDPKILYANYPYVTSNSETMKKHFEELTKVLKSEQRYESVLEIGSNDGAYLEYLSSLDVSVAGIDPADNLAEASRKDGIPTITGVFDSTTAHHVSCISPRGFDLIVARHVFCHVDNWKEFIDTLSIVSHKDTLVAIEVPYVGDLLERGEFDTIYHEHTSYLSIKAVTHLLRGSEWRMHGIRRFPVHGGAIVLLLRRMDHESDNEAIAITENITADTWRKFAMVARINMDALNRFVDSENLKGNQVVGMGASAKSTVWVNACGFTRKDMNFITDTTPQKLWKFSPGSDIPIVDEGAILRELPEFVVCFAWNYRDEILEKNKLARSKGVKFVFPIPKLEIV